MSRRCELIGQCHWYTELNGQTKTYSLSVRGDGVDRRAKGWHYPDKPNVQTLVRGRKYNLKVEL